MATPEEKKERKVLRAMLMNRVERTLSVELRLRSTRAQIRKYCRTLVDQILAGKNPYEVQRMPERVPVRYIPADEAII